MRLLKNVRLLRNGHTHHRENLASAGYIGAAYWTIILMSFAAIILTRMSGPRQSVEVA